MDWSRVRHPLFERGLKRTKIGLLVNTFFYDEYGCRTHFPYKHGCLEDCAENGRVLFLILIGVKCNNREAIVLFVKYIME